MDSNKVKNYIDQLLRLEKDIIMKIAIEHSSMN